MVRSVAGDYTEEHTYIESYLDGELDWELLVDAVGEDMARGVRIAEKNLESDSIDEFKKNYFDGCISGVYSNGKGHLENIEFSIFDEQTLNFSKTIQQHLNNIDVEVSIRSKK